MSKDKMEAIKFSLVNLNDQIKVFNQDKADYITAFDEGQLAKGKAQPNGAYFTDVYTNNSQFGIGDNGDLSFTVGGQTSLFKDRAGTWNPRNNISETFFLDNFQKEIGNAQKGGKFIESTTYNRLFNNLRSTGNDGLQALITQDLVGDRTNNTFEQQFASGTLDPKIYAGYESYKLDKSDPRFKKGKYEYDTDFMFKNENGDKVRGLVAQYFTNVTRTGHGLNYSQKTDGGDQYKNYTVDGYTGVNYPTAKAQYDNMLVPGKINYDRKGSYKYISDGKGNTDVYIQKATGKYEKIETIPTNDALARRGLDLFGEGYITPKTDIKFIDFNNDRDGDGIPNNIDREPDNPNN